MPPKRPGSPIKDGDKPKRARKAITLDTKLSVLKKSDEGMRVKDIANLFGLAATTVVTIKKDKDKIMNSTKSVTPLSAKRVTKHRPLIMEEMERLLSLWVDDMCNRKDSPMTNQSLQEKALSLYEDLATQEAFAPGPSGGGDGNPQPAFTASKGWLDRFRNRYNFHFVTQSGEAASADKAAAQAYLPVLLDIIQEGGYKPQQVFNIDETALYWKRMPKKTAISREEKKAPGHKASKDRVSLLLGGNAAGDLKLKPVLIYHSENPRALKGQVKSTLPVIFRSNRKGWMNRNLFQDWFTHHFCPVVERYCASNNLSHKALLLLDNAPGHPANLSDLSDQVRVEFLPKNTTSLLQPMDQGVIATFKAYYLRRTFRKMVTAVDADPNLTIIQFWKGFNIKNAIDTIADAWDEVKDSNMNGVWKKVWPDCINSFTGFPRVQPVVRDIVGLAHTAGMDEVDEEGVNELLESHEEELSNEDLMLLEQDRAAEGDENEEEETAPQLELTCEILAEAFADFDRGVSRLANNDPHRDRSLRLENDIQKALTAYKQLYEEKISQAKQTKVTSFFTKIHTTAAAPVASTSAALPASTSAESRASTSAEPTTLTHPGSPFLDFSEDDHNPDSPCYSSLPPSPQ